MDKDKKESIVRWLWRSAISLGIVLLILAAFGVTLRLNFLLGDEIIIHLSPQQDSFWIHYGEQRIEVINLSIETPLYCAASCTYAFTDKGQDVMLDEGNLTLRNGDRYFREYLLSPSRAGRGQDVYRFDVTCRSIHSALCPARGEVTYRSSLILLNYDLSEQEKALRQESQDIMLPFLARLAALDIALKTQSGRIVLLAPTVKMDDLQERKAAIEGGFSSLLLDTERLKALWSAENYSGLRQELGDFPLDNTFDALQRNVTMLSAAVAERIALHNALVNRTISLVAEANAAGDIYALAVAANDSRLRAAVLGFIHQANETQRSFSRLDFKGYGSLQGALAELSDREKAIENDSKSLRAGSRARWAFLLAKERDRACLLSGEEDSCLLNGTMANIYDAYQHELSTEWPSSTVVARTCSEIADLKQEHLRIGNETQQRLREQNISFPADSSFNRSVTDVSANISATIMEAYAESLSAVNDPAFADLLSLWMGAPSSTAMNGTGIREAKDYLLAHLDIGQDTAAYEASFCPLPAQFSHALLPANLTAAVDPPLPPVNSTIGTSLPDNPALCCIFGECAPCCTAPSCASQEETFPIIFLHGHAFNKASAPAYSLDAFNLIQYALEEEGYLNAGIVTPLTATEGISAGEWGLSGKPVSVKASYYLDAYLEGKQYVIIPTKSENIDTYALRLKDVIATVKERTGREKVNIVAHSMGGLVARRYMQAFGDADVNRLIMIATPNQGIAGKVNDLCPLFGEEKECQDMQPGSLFLNRLNDPSRQPQRVQLYTIAGIGCDTDRKDGDGVVAAESAHLPQAEQFNVSGTCGGIFGEQLHTALLDISRYPQTMGIIKSALRGDSS